MWSPLLKETAILLAANKDSKEKLSSVLAEATISLDQKQALKMSFMASAGTSDSGTSPSDYWA